MVAIASRARTGFWIAVAAGAVGAALVAGKGPAPATCECATDQSPAIQVSPATAIVRRGPNDLAVQITTPERAATHRPVSVAVVLDRSGSMHGAPIQNARDAAKALVDRLTPADAFSIVTYSDRAELVAAITRATPDAKRAAKLAIDQIVDDGGTCTSCGLDRGAAELAQTPVAGARRIILISDGQANEGIWDRDALIDHARELASTGGSISAVGVGLDFDEQTLIRIADLGRGNYHFIADTAGLSAMLADEVRSLQGTVATNVRLMVDEHGFATDFAYANGLERTGEHTVELPLADLRAGETREIVLHGAITGRDVGTFTLRWSDPEVPAATEVWTAHLCAPISGDEAQIASSRVGWAAEAIADAHAAAAIDAASTALERRELAQAMAVIEQQHERAAIGSRAADALARARDEVDAASHDDGTRLVKALRTQAYQLRR